MPDSTEHQQPDDPAIAFRNLQAHVMVARDAAEGLKKYIEANPPPKYDKELKAITEGVGRLTSQLAAIQEFPEKSAQSIAGTADTMFAEAKRRIDYAENMVERDRAALGTLVGTVRTQQQQRQWLIWTGLGAFAAGFIFLLVLGRALPLGLNTYFAAGIMGYDRWHAGQSLMQAGNPDGWNLFMSDANLTNANRAKVDVCRVAAAKTKQDQNCAITVAPDNGR